MTRSSIALAVGLALASIASSGHAQSLLDLCPCGRLPAVTYVAGAMDNYAQPVDAASRGPELNAAFPNNIWKSFDDPTVNAHVGHTFANLPGDIVCAQLEIHLRPTGDYSDNDTLYLGLLPSLTGQFAWAIRLKDLPGTGGTWNSPLNPAAFTLDLDALPGGPTTSLLSKLNAEHRLDVLVQDDTQVDYIKLTLHTFPQQTVTVGIADNFAAPTEGTSRGPQLNAAFPGAPWKDLDDTSSNHYIGHTFGNLTGNVVQASLEVRLKPHADVPDNDTLNLGFGQTSTASFSSLIRNLPGAGGTWSSNPATTFQLDLAALPNGGNLLPKINVDHRLDILVQDDTAGDFLRLRYRTCPAPQRFGGLDHVSLGQAHLSLDTDGDLLISNIGSSGEDGARINLGRTKGWGFTWHYGAGPVGSFRSWTMYGTVDGVEGQPTFTARDEVTAGPSGDRIVVSQDSSALGAQQIGARFFAVDGSLLYETSLPNGALYTFDNDTSAQLSGARERWDKTCVVVRVPPIKKLEVVRGPTLTDVARIETFALRPTKTVTDFTFVDSKAANLAAVDLADEVLLLFDHPNRALGGAALEAIGDGLTASALGTSGAAGIAIDLGSVDAVSASLAPIDLAGTAPPGAYLVAEARGELDGVADQPLGSLTITKAGNETDGGFDLATSFAGLGTNLQRMQIFREGSLVQEEVIPAGLAARSSYWPRLLGKIGGRTECYRGMFPPGTRFTFPGTAKRAAVGDEIRLLAENAAPVGSKSSFSLRAAGLDELTLTDVTVGSDANCTPGPTNLCLNGGRFKVEASFAAPTGDHGSAQAVPLTADTGYFYFFNPTNVELVVKVLNGCLLNQRFWAFSAGMTDVEVDLKVTDTLTGEVKHYLNLQGTAYPPNLDTDAFATCGAGKLADGASALAATHETASELTDLLASLNAGALADAAGKAATGTDLSLRQNRFRVRATFRTPLGQTGQGQAIQLTDETGYFWFFDAANVEVVVKALDGCGQNQHYWIFAAGMTDVEVVLTVTDTANGTTKTYTNPISTPFRPIQDTSAFATCP